MTMTSVSTGRPAASGWSHGGAPGEHGNAGEQVEDDRREQEHQRDPDDELRQRVTASRATDRRGRRGLSRRSAANRPSPTPTASRSRPARQTRKAEFPSRGSTIDETDCAAAPSPPRLDPPHEARPEDPLQQARSQCQYWDHRGRSRPSWCSSACRLPGSPVSEHRVGRVARAAPASPRRR